MVAIDEWFFRWINYTFSAWTAQATGWTLNAMGIQTVVRETFVNSKTCRLEIIGECTGYYLCSLYLAAVLALPSRWSRKLLGIALGVPAILVVNQFRLVCLCYLSGHYPEHFEMLHMVVLQSLMVLVTILFWLAWATTLARVDESPSS